MDYHEIGSSTSSGYAAGAPHVGQRPASAPLVLARYEYFHTPGARSKDRIAVRMIEAAEASGDSSRAARSSSRPAATPASGLAIVAQRKGYHCIFVCPDKVSGDKINVLRPTAPRSWSARRPVDP